VKKRVPTKMERIVLKNDTPLGLHLLQLIQGLEATVGNGLVRERPQSLAGLQLRRVGWQKHEVDALWHHHLSTLMPACSIQHQHDAPIRASANRLRKVREGKAEDLDSHRRQQEPKTLPCFWTKEAVHVEPFVPLLHANDWTLPFPCPDPPNDRPQPDTMLIHTPGFYQGLWILLLDLVDLP